jgi:hypothetical protein
VTTLLSEYSFMDPIKYRLSKNICCNLGSGKDRKMHYRVLIVIVVDITFDKVDEIWCHGSHQPLQENLVRDFDQLSSWQQIYKWIWLWEVVHISNWWNCLWIHEWKQSWLSEYGTKIIWLTWVWPAASGLWEWKFTGKKRRDYGLVCMYWILLQLKI